MSYWNNICNMQKRQTEKGLQTYGQTLEENTELDMLNRLNYLEEELIDGLMYVEHIKTRLIDLDEKNTAKEPVGKIRICPTCKKREFRLQTPRYCDYCGQKLLPKL